MEEKVREESFSLNKVFSSMFVFPTGQCLSALRSSQSTKTIHISLILPLWGVDWFISVSFPEMQSPIYLQTNKHQYTLQYIYGT